MATQGINLVTPSAATAPSTGAMRYNTLTQMIEVFDGTIWTGGLPAPPQDSSWQTWLLHLAFMLEKSLFDTDNNTPQQFIQNGMQDRFPGAYRVERGADGWWHLVHDSPVDETWFLLQYA